jgi:hypothetical protein
MLKQMKLGETVIALAGKSESEILTEKTEEGGDYIELMDIMENFIMAYPSSVHGADKALKENIEYLLKREKLHPTKIYLSQFEYEEDRMEEGFIEGGKLFVHAKITFKDGSEFNGRVFSTVHGSDKKNEYQLVELILGTEELQHFG